jgi:NAD-dependent DNA ligase
MEKIDGLSCLLEIIGKEVKLFTRGNGYNGTNISSLRDDLNLGFSFSRLKSYIPKYEESILIRGEIVIKKEVFEKKYSKNFKNARNFVAGVVNSKTKDYMMIQDLSFIAYEYMNEFEGSKLRLLESIGFEVPKYEICDITKLNQDVLTKMYEQYKKNAEYDIDGLVVSDMLKHKENNGDNPKYTIAFKVNTEFTLSTVEYVEWNISKNGLIKPRVKVEPIQLCGVTINFATGFNAKFIKENNIGKGTIVQLVRSGEVVPNIQSVVKSTKAEMPEFEYEWNETNVDIVAIDKNTKEQWLKKMAYMFEICEVKGVKEGILSKLYEGEINTDIKLFGVKKVDDLDGIEGLQSKSKQNVFSAIQQLKMNMTFKKLMSGSSIFQNFGERKIIKILEKIPYVKEYIEDETMQLDKIILIRELADNGFHKSGQAFIDSIETYKEYYQQMKDFFNLDEIVFEEDELEMLVFEDEKSNMEKENIVFSGFRDKELEKKMEKKGHVISKDITKKVTLLVVKDLESGSTKIEKAKSYGIKIVSLEEFQSKY